MQHQQEVRLALLADLAHDGIVNIDIGTLRDANHNGVTLTAVQIMHALVGEGLACLPNDVRTELWLMIPQDQYDLFPESIRALISNPFSPISRAQTLIIYEQPPQPN